MRGGGLSSIWFTAMGWLFGCFGKRRSRFPALCSRSSNNHHHRRNATNNYDARYAVHQRPLQIQMHKDVQETRERLSGMQVCSDVQRPKKKIEDILSISISESLEVVSAVATEDTSFKLEEIPKDSENAEKCETYEVGITEPTTSGEVAVAEMKQPTTSGEVAAAEKQQQPPLSLNLLNMVPAAAAMFMFPRKRNYRCYVWQEPLSPVAEVDSSLSSSEEESAAKNVKNRSCSLTLQQETENVFSSSTAAEAAATTAEFGSPVSTRSSNSSDDTEITPIQCFSPNLSPSASKRCKRSNAPKPQKLVNAEKENYLQDANNSSSNSTSSSNSNSSNSSSDSSKFWIYSVGKSGEFYKQDTHNSSSVLTPVENVLQWRQLQKNIQQQQVLVDSINTINKTPSSTSVTAITTTATARYAAADDEDEDDDGIDDDNDGDDAGDGEEIDDVEEEIENENLSFFREIQQSSMQVTTTPTATATALVWDGKGIPNTTTKYKEDQKVSWHSTPFEVRLEKALQVVDNIIPQRELFRS